MCEKAYYIYSMYDRLLTFYDTCPKFWICFVLVDARCDKCGYWHRLKNNRKWLDTADNQVCGFTCPIT